MLNIKTFCLKRSIKTNGNNGSKNEIGTGIMYQIIIICTHRVLCKENKMLNFYQDILKSTEV